MEDKNSKTTILCLDFVACWLRYHRQAKKGQTVLSAFPHPSLTIWLLPNHLSKISPGSPRSGKLEFRATQLPFPWSLLLNMNFEVSDGEFCFHF